MRWHFGQEGIVLAGCPHILSGLVFLGTPFTLKSQLMLVKFFILFRKISSTAKSPSVTGDLSDLIVIFTPLRLISFATFPAFKKSSISSSAIFFKFKSRNFTLFYSHYYNIYNNYFNKSTIYAELNFNVVFK